MDCTSISRSGLRRSYSQTGLTHGSGRLRFLFDALVALSSQATLAQPFWQPWTGNADHANANLFGKFDPLSERAGWVYATDADTGTVVWRLRTPGPVAGGLTVTAGGVAFVGDIDGNQYALDARTGQVLWKRQLGGAIGGGIVTYRAHDAQRIAVAIGMTSPSWQTQQTTAKVVILGIPALRSDFD